VKRSRRENLTIWTEEKNVKEENREQQKEKNIPLVEKHLYCYQKFPTLRPRRNLVGKGKETPSLGRK